MERLILEYILHRLNSSESTEDERSDLVMVANQILSMYVMENS